MKHFTDRRPKGRKTAWRRKVSHDGGPVDLTGNPADVFAELARRAGYDVDESAVAEWREYAAGGGRGVNQTMRGSVSEATVSTAAGFLVSWLATPFILAAFGYHVGPAQSLGIVLVYTALSWLRSLAVRRYFERRLAR